MKYNIKTECNALITPNIKVGDFLNLKSYVGLKNPANGKRILAQDLQEFEVALVDDKLAELICRLEKEFNCKITLTPHGGYRPSSPIDLNGAVGGARGSTHRTGKGADVLLEKNGAMLDVPAMAVATEFYMHKNKILGGVGVYAKNNKHFHIDVRGSWAAWFCSYSGAGTPAQGGRPCNFRQGNKAAGIVLIQRRLNGLGYDCKAADGFFGDKTTQALKLYQKENGLTADGVFGAKSNDKMGVLPW